MAKSSKQRPVRQKKDQSGCMWGIISMFDFRHGRTPRRLLSDRRRYPDNNTQGSSHPTLEANLPTISQEMHPSIEDGEKIKKPSDLMSTRVKELIEEEMFIDQDTTKPVRKDHEQKHKSKKLKKSINEGTSINHQVSAQKSSQYRDLEALVKEILLIYKKRNEQNGLLDTGEKGSFPIVEEKLFVAVEALLNEKSANGDHKKTNHSKEMFQMLSSNREMFMKILRDQYSILLKEDQKSKSTDQGPEEPMTRKHRKFFRRRSKSQESMPLNEKGRIVVLKSGSSENQVPVENDTQSEVHGSQFSFMEIKRRFKHAMGKDRRSPGPTGKTGVDGGWSSPNRDHFYMERFARVANGLKPGDRFSKLRDSESENDNANDRVSNIYVEAKKHLSEMLTSGDEDAETMMRSLPKSLGRILSLREYNSFSPVTSPRVRTRHLSCEDLSLVNKSQPLTTIDNSEKKDVVPNSLSFEGVQEAVKSPSCDEEHKEQTEACEPHDTPNEDQPSDSFELELHEEPTVASKSEEHKISPAKPSPVSVLEPLFSDDDISPARSVSLPVEAAVQPLCIQFDEAVSCAENQQIRITDSGESEETPFEYVEAVLLSSDLNWSEFENRWISSAPILDLSIFHEVETFSSRAKHDQRLLFDSANEALEEVCNRYIPESSFVKRNVWPVPKGMDLINEVWSRLESCLCKAYPRDLSKLVRNDLETSSRMWLDLRSESREIVIKIEESIFEETIEDALTSLFNDCVNGEILDDETNNAALLCS
ncbi:hypothetical protein M8C21_013118 [Ambrosia artemisiifolia]|uniref:DUF4378 domain-containing protein n=1 Tax=Ambrosia artemisiifolia TaxID=4212 RepID=A0AAD5DFH3_AMBAR|nr:hypothetical protein M8C21_013118 [Ambrosia artemisiifolia]